MKTKEELELIKKQVEKFNKKLTELNEDELKQITGGSLIWDIAVKLKESIPVLNKEEQ